MRTLALATFRDCASRTCIDCISGEAELGLVLVLEGGVKMEEVAESVGAEEDESEEEEGGSPPKKPPKAIFWLRRLEYLWF
jgi:hypothetical protein